MCTLKNRHIYVVCNNENYFVLPSEDISFLLNIILLLLANKKWRENPSLDITANCNCNNVVVIYSGIQP